MIEGLKVDVRAGEIVDRLDERIRYHRARVECSEQQLAKTAAMGDEPDEEDGAMPFPGAVPSPRFRIEHRLRGHQERIAALTFLREHVVEDEVYRLSEEDLTALEILSIRMPW